MAPLERNGRMGHSGNRPRTQGYFRETPRYPPEKSSQPLFKGFLRASGEALRADLQAPPVTRTKAIRTSRMIISDARARGAATGALPTGFTDTHRMPYGPGGPEIPERARPARHSVAGQDPCAFRTPVRGQGTCTRAEYSGLVHAFAELSCSFRVVRRRPGTASNSVPKPPHLRAACWRPSDLSCYPTRVAVSTR